QSEGAYRYETTQEKEIRLVSPGCRVLGPDRFEAIGTPRSLRGFSTSCGKREAGAWVRKLFGTDGIRGVAGDYPLDKKTVHAIGPALGDHLPQGPRRVVIGQDTRESSAWIADALSCGLRESGVAVKSAGVITTPGVAYLAHSQGFSAGVVISASHN